MLVLPHLSPPMVIRVGGWACRLRRRRRRRLPSAGGGAAVAACGVALASACAHRVVGGIGPPGGGRLGRLGVLHERASVAAMPLADFASSARSFGNAAAEFFGNLSA